MKHNMGIVERYIRLIGGFALFLLAWFVPEAYYIFFGRITSANIAGLILSIAGILLFITGATAYCPINKLAEHNSCEACNLGETHRHNPV